MQRTKGSTSIAIGSILTILGSIFGILLGIFLLRAERFGAVLTNVAAEIRDMYPVASFLFSMGEAFGFIIMTINDFLIISPCRKVGEVVQHTDIEDCGTSTANAVSPYT